MSIHNRMTRGRAPSAPSETKVFPSPGRTPDTDIGSMQAELISASESKKRIEKILSALNLTACAGNFEPLIHWSDNKVNGTSAKKIVAELFRLALFAHAAVASDALRTGLALPVPWDRRTLLPTHPTLAADATICARRIKTDSLLASALCGSFSGWSTIANQTLKCACGPGMRLRDVSLEILAQTLLRTDDEKPGVLCITALAGIRSQNPSHLDHHYNFSKESNVSGDIRIVSSIEADISRTETDPLFRGTITTEECAKEFNRDALAALIQQALQKITQERSGHAGA